MVRLGLRTGYVALLGWPVVAASCSGPPLRGVHNLYPDEAKRQAYQATIGTSPVSMAFNGRGYGLLTQGGITANEFGALGMLPLPVIAAHLAVRLTRTQEDAGRADLVSAAPIGRAAPLVAAALNVTGSILLTGALSVATLVGSGLPVAGSLRYGLALVLLMSAFLGVGLLAGQVAQAGRGAHGLAFGMIGACYLARALIDGRQVNATWLTP